jgi:hypothetical protein
MANSFSTQAGVLGQTNSSQAGILPNSNPYGLTLPNTNQPQASGLNAGGSSVMATPQPGLGAFNSTTTNNGNGGTTTKPTPNPSVLAQQQALNKLGAGLVEDGLAGPLTTAAIAKYGTGGTGTSGTTSGVIAPTTSADQFSRQTGQPNPGYINPNAPTPTPTPTPTPAPTPTPTTNYATSGTTPAVPQSNIIGGLLTQANGTNPLADQYRTQLQDIANTQAQSNKNLDTSGIDTSLATGQENVLNRTYAAESQAAQTGLSNALTQTGQQIQAGTAAASANAPITGVAYGTQTIQPGMLNQQNSGGTSGGTLNPLNNISSIASQVISGKLSLADAQNLGGGVSSWGGALNQEISKQSPGFNFNQANVNAQTQGALAPQSSLATQELTNLQNTLSAVPAWQQTGIPAINALGSLVDNALGMGSAQGLKSAISAAKSAISTALGTAYNTTPTSFTSMVDTWIPENPTPAQVQSAINQFDTLMKARVSSFASPGTTTNPVSSGGNTPANGRAF